ncbi:hypothetical protein N7462_005090 [Penicillium macrosclerotiorum]|uniref:uncharacterized protein n=1 Tax=Penicillium macrosclerotiorum TaxID=303699 RepID=UPI0025471507|nr:uncharacterized protein N7462_005090 [Penicillium macrosclerotiorum]KAJ5690698.1 hypothetical protein N7462_005090 [Penicillium macrosclerotiorum]
MADFSEFTGPSDDWVALEPTIPTPPKLSVEELKRTVNQGREELAAKAMIGQCLASEIKTQDLSITTRDGESLEARSYRPSGIPSSEKLPVYVHLHGGGYLFGTLSSEDAICARIVASRVEKGSPVVVFNVNYRHTPEYRYPTAWDDVEDAFIWLHEHIGEIGGLADQVVVGGISAGAQLTASLTLAQIHGDNKQLAACPRIRGQVLMIPCVVQMQYYAPRQDLLSSPEVSSLVQCAEAPILPISRIQLFMSLLGLDEVPDAGRDLRMNPGNATASEVKELPPTTFGIAGNDPLRDEGLFYGKLLSENGVPTNVHVFRGVPHGFRRYGDKLSASKKWDQVMSDGISWALSNPSPEPFEINSD